MILKVLALLVTLLLFAIPGGGEAAASGSPQSPVADPCLTGDPFELAKLAQAIADDLPPSAPLVINRHITVQTMRQADMRGRDDDLIIGPKPPGNPLPSEPPADTASLDNAALRIFNTRTQYEFRVTFSDELLRTINRVSRGQRADCSRRTRLTRSHRGTDVQLPAARGTAAYADSDIGATSHLHGMACGCARWLERRRRHAHPAHSYYSLAMAHDHQFLQQRVRHRGELHDDPHRAAPSDHGSPLPGGLWHQQLEDPSVDTWSRWAECRSLRFIMDGSHSACRQ